MDKGCAIWVELNLSPVVILIILIGFVFYSVLIGLLDVLFIAQSTRHTRGTEVGAAAGDRRNVARPISGGQGARPTG